MGRHHVFMLILEFLDFSEWFYVSRLSTMSRLHIHVCLSVHTSVCLLMKLASTRKVASQFFLINLYLDSTKQCPGRCEAKQTFLFKFNRSKTFWVILSTENGSCCHLKVLLWIIYICIQKRMEHKSIEIFYWIFLKMNNLVHVS